MFQRGRAVHIYSPDAQTNAIRVIFGFRGNDSLSVSVIECSNCLRKASAEATEAVANDLTVLPSTITHQTPS